LLKVRATDICTGSAPDLARLPVFVPCMGRRIVLLYRGVPEGEDGTDSDGGPEGTPST